jgi:peptidyl-tRNA hydrolase, PTH1 family
MKLIAGLGNPGTRYINTRHNIGFRVVERLARRHDINLKRKLFSNAKESRFTVSGKGLLVIEPLSFMNLSGAVVARYARSFKIENSDILVVCDDLNLPLGTIRINPKGSAGGHNGLSSVIKSLKTEQVPRLRCGIKTDDKVSDLAEYVLSDFSAQETGRVDSAIEQAVLACESWISHGAEKAMSIYNKALI